VNPESWGTIAALGSALKNGSSSLGSLPLLLKRVIREEMWREFPTPRSREPVRHDSFERFVVTPPTEGLGADVALLRRMMRDDPEALDLLDQALQGRNGRPTQTVDNIHGTARPSGTSSDASLRRLRKDRPDLHAEVIVGNLSPHAAMVKAGFRPRTVTVRLDDPTKIAATLRRKLTPDELDRLVTALIGGAA
jgi:hypothetical protein